MKTALFPGSFDPVTIAHADILERALPLFDKIFVGIGWNTSKPGFLPLEKRLEMLRAVFSIHPNVEVVVYEGLTVDFCKRIGAGYIVRGVRSVADFEYERAIAQVNQTMMPSLETIIILSKPEYSAISSTIVREIMRNQGNVSQFVPSKALELI
ncbi:pantetheine-phosphate adenylyltransferase [Pedobacter sp. JY14-1]|uniref:pantetheine-phosphate adenylyltransferase n=1 Tax=Pedobacter sp. JY14-1 TaxID=3034151 RepID=UPI0023E21AE5|nr:pantetheine-phosphate adenylyltransferase [Pedobacter sp. JY14-1]